MLKESELIKNLIVHGYLQMFSKYILVSLNTLTGSISEAVAYMIASMELHPGDLYDTTMTHSTEKMELGTESAHSTQSTTVRTLQGLYNGIIILVKLSIKKTLLILLLNMCLGRISN